LAIENITGRKQTKEELRASEEKYRALFERSIDGVYESTIDGKYIDANPALVKMLGYENKEELMRIDIPTQLYVSKNDRPEHTKRDRVFETKLKRKDGSVIYVGISSRVVYKNNKPTFYEGVVRDITEQKKIEKKLKFLSFHDKLTGLYNRAYFDEELDRLDTERQLPITIVMGDLNGLKVINDAFGHSGGDMLLRNISDILKESFRKEDIISRWGGDEFIAILPKTSVKDAESIIKRIKELCEEKSTTEMPLSISIGTSTKKSSSENIDDILKEAEDKMYKSKIAESTPIHESLIQSLRVGLKKGEYRTETHIKKMEDYAVLIGKRLNLSSIKLEELKLLMNLHNIGKLALADEIMTKKGRLTAEEWKIIKEIPEIGYRIAESSTTLKPVAESILTHHEWYNGQGYPRGIKGEEIPVLSRISFLINAYDAMTSDKPYRKRMTKKEAMEEIKKCSGTQFDPKVVNVFLGILGEE